MCDRLVTVLMGSSGRPVAQSMTVCMPTKVAGMVSGLLRSAWERERENNNNLMSGMENK